MSDTRYGREYTARSFDELKNLSRWMTEKHGSYPVIIGGWAVWSYYKDSYGSVDIDIVFPDDQSVIDVLHNGFFPAHGYKKYREHLFGPDKYGKPIPGAIGEDIIMIDIFSASRPREDEEGLGIYMDWGWVFQNQRKSPIADELFIYVPEPELLVTLKIIAALGRTKSAQIEADNKYLLNKIWKDYYDIALLTNNVLLNENQLGKFLKNSKIDRKLLRQCLDGYIGKQGQDALEKANTNQDKIEKVFESYMKKKKSK